jgi:alkylation response protein AidB-like acyl-CoA dehydrogenase
MSERYHPNPDQVAFAASAGKSLASLLPLSRLHEAHDESAHTWAALSELGVFGISTPEELGGSALGATEEALVVIELGRRVVAPSVLATLGAAHLRSPQTLRERRVAAGYRRAERIVFVEDSAAELLLVRGASGAVLVERPTASHAIDLQLWSSQLRETTELGEPLAEATRSQTLRLRLIDAAALAGIARAALDMAVAYAGLREQFGRPIGSFQAVKHHCANMALAARCACDLVSFAAVAVDGSRDDATLQVESALYVAGSAAISNCGKNIQVHGGMGFSEEADPHHLLKRAHVLIEIAGGLEAALARVGDCPPSAELAAHERTG